MISSLHKCQHCINKSINNRLKKGGLTAKWSRARHKTNNAVLVTISADSALVMTPDRLFNQTSHLNLILCEAGIECTCADVTVTIPGVMWRYFKWITSLKISNQDHWPLWTQAKFLQSVAWHTVITIHLPFNDWFLTVNYSSGPVQSRNWYIQVKPTPSAQEKLWT